MARFYRFRLPPWARKCIVIIEVSVTPIMVFQLVRTLLIPTTFDILLTGVLIGLVIAFYLEWI
ncbi:hypothetical protein ACFQ4N_07095 [Oceanobacillus iheyensis]|uniref:Uncharacterized protein n=1 Tax=Oceanobacillus iheyensis (strain DSM 14371 / CIP 107618 / JCM 11309 / KCTC 3954 / HTE831) TaxID=221109 RepID=Q8EPN1_OCEIH|nr:hypothetical protein [Oceanobacillus iheyensis]BAC14018.1 hypothetical protein [Oceanobacillus iheyensis HTE831]